MIDDLMTIQKSHSDHDRMNIVCSELFQWKEEAHPEQTDQDAKRSTIMQNNEF